eukprot:TRINITY_DN7990_c0_g3_i1.p1 TRINITY_DN7990_c0_g3~~TRINITY_DN7990_c0_g3_i1.p1  ORF type:complete len:618 (+),score=164.36 TRINITY_DN7990_c0_g3_i1:80-1933(+)
MTVQNDAVAAALQENSEQPQQAAKQDVAEGQANGATSAEPLKEKTNGGMMEGVTAEYVTKEVLLGATIGFAQIPESVAFAFLANVKPPIALHAAWMVGACCSLFGGRPGMVNGATGAFAAIIATFLPEPKEQGGNGEGIETLFPSVMLAGVFMFIFAALDFSRFILLLPAPVMVGFCNGLAIVIGLAQLHPFVDADTHEFKQGTELMWMLITTLVSMLVMEYFPKVPFRIFQIIPSSLLSIIAAVVIEFCIVRPSGSRTDTIGDVSEFSSETAYPWPFFIEHPGGATDYDLSILNKSQNMVKILVQGFLLATVGTIESLMTSEVVESYVKTPSDGKRTITAMGVGNLLSGFFGGMGGNAMIGLSTINVLNGGKGRLAPCTTAFIVFAAVAGAYEALNYIPVSALAGIMLVVVMHTFKWFSVGIMVSSVMPRAVRKALSSKYYSFDRKIPRIEAFTILLVTFVSYAMNIAYAVGAGLALCAIHFAWTSAQKFDVKERMVGEKKVYDVNGPLFFTSANAFIKILKPETDPDTVEVRFGFSNVMDYTAIATMHKLTTAYQAKGKKITFHSLCASSQNLIEEGKTLVQSIEYNPVEIPDVNLPDVNDQSYNEGVSSHVMQV